MILKNLLYIFQLEDYDRKRFIQFSYRNPNWLAYSMKSKLQWTVRSGLCFLLSVLLSAVLVVSIYNYLGLLWAIAILCICTLVLPIIVVFSDILISPMVLFQKWRIVSVAKSIVRKNKLRGMVTIGITGSFGKTSMKDVLVSILEQKYTVFIFPGNINTDIGISQYLIKNQSSICNADILATEMGAYKRGDIKRLCNIVDPDYSITTSIGECHLDRFGSIENIAKAKFELANATNLKAFLNSSDKGINKYADLCIGDEIRTVKVHGGKAARDIESIDGFRGISFEYSGQMFQTRIVARYIVNFAVIAFKVAEELKIDVYQMQSGLKLVDFVPHRLEIVRNEQADRIIIDDSYNGNFEGFLAGLDILSHAVGRKVVVTPGIVELGDRRARHVHRDLAELYARRVDLVLLIKNRNTEVVANRFRELGYDSYRIYTSTEEAHRDLSNLLQDGDTILFQNDTTDNYR